MDCLSATAPPTDRELQEAAVNALTWYRVVAPGTVVVIAENGYLTLTGLVADMQQRGAAERAVRHLRGVRGVWNALKVVQAPERCRPRIVGEHRTAS